MLYCSIMYISTRSAACEKIAIGLLLFTSEKILFEYSNVKLNICSKLLSKPIFQLVKDSVIETNLAVKKGLHFNSDNPKHSNLSSYFDYFTYIFTHMHNLIIYSDPAEIEIELNTENFNKLFSKLIF